MTDFSSVTEGVRPGELYYIAAKSGVGKSYVHCPHCSNPASEHHPCPYKEDIHDDDEGVPSMNKEARMNDKDLERKLFKCERSLTHIGIAILVISLALTNLVWRTWD